jgi:branched-chain amino acid transport system substrate-binding protein
MIRRGTHRSFRRIAALVATGALAVAACGGDDDSSDEASSEAATGEATGADEPTAEATATAETSASASAEEPSAEAPAGAFDVDAMLAADPNCGTVPEGDPLIIGFAADKSEVGGFADVPIEATLNHLVNLVNCSGGVNGTPIELIVQDVQGDPEVAQRAATDLVEAGAHVILGPPFADTGQAVLQAVGASRAVVFVASTEPVLSDPSIYSFLTTFDDTAQAYAAAEWAYDNGYTRAITFSSEGPYFGYNPEKFAEKFTELGGEVVLDQSYVPFEDFDFSAQANEVANVADGSEILYTAMIAPQVVALRANLDAVGVDIEYIGADAFDVSGITTITDGTAEGILYTTHGFAEPGSRFATMLESFEAATGAPSEAPGFSGLAGDALLVAIQGFLDAGNADPLAIADAIAAIDGLPTITATTTYAGTNGVPDRPVFVLQMQGDAPVVAGEY